MPFINSGNVVSNKLNVNVSPTLPATVVSMNGLHYFNLTADTSNESICCTGQPSTAGDFYNQGWRFAPDGLLRLFDVDANGLPPSNKEINGIAVAGDGRVCMSVASTATKFVHGWPVTDNGVICVTVTNSASVSPGAFNLSGLSNEGNVELNWTTSTNAATYRVQRNAVDLGTTVNLTWTDDTGVPGTAYNYGVIAQNSVGNTNSTPATINIASATVGVKYTTFTATIGQIVSTPTVRVITDNFTIIYHFTTTGTPGNRYAAADYSNNFNDLGVIYSLWDPGAQSFQVSVAIGGSGQVFPTVAVPDLGQLYPWLKFTRIGTSAQFYVSENGLTYIPLGPAQSCALGAIPSAGIIGLAFGSYIPPYSISAWSGNFYRLQILNNVDATIYDCNVNSWVSGTTFVSGGDTWTLGGGLTVVTPAPLGKAAIYTGAVGDRVTSVHHDITDDFTIQFRALFQGSPSGFYSILNFVNNPNNGGVIYLYYNAGAGNVAINFSGTGGAFDATDALEGGVNDWMQMVRVGSSIQLSTSPDGTTWTPVGTPLPIANNPVVNDPAATFSMGENSPYFGIPAFIGRIYNMKVLNNVGATIYNCDPGTYVSGLTFTSGGDVYTIGGTVTVS